MCLTDMTRHYLQRRRRRTRGRWTWRQRRQGSWISSQPDYVLAREEDRGRFRRVVVRIPRHHRSDHRAVVAHLKAEPPRRLQRYRRRFARFPVQLPRFGPRTEQEEMFEELKAECERPHPRERPANEWISARTWKLVDRGAVLNRKGRLSQANRRALRRQIDASLKVDRRERTRKVGETVTAHLGNGELQEAWHSIQGWYRAASDRAPKPCRQTLERQTREREELYARVPSPGDPIRINVDPKPVRDDAPTDAELRVVVRGLRNGRAGGASLMRAEDIKAWLRGVEDEEDPQVQGRQGAGDAWRAFVALIRSIWETGTIPQQMAWVIVVLLPKGGGDYRGIGLLEPCWKVVEGVILNRWEVIEIHDCLHGSVKGRGTGTAILECKLVQQLAYIEQAPLYEIFIDLKKAFDAMDRERCLDILQAYGVGPKCLHLLRVFWETAVLVCRAVGRYGEPFQAERGVTQGGPLSPRMFNILVDAVVREWLRQVLGEEAAKHGYGDAVAYFCSLYYVDDAVAQDRDRDRLQRSADILADLFDRVGLRTNTIKTKVKICVPGRIRTALSHERYAESRLGLYTAQEARNSRTACHKCGKWLKAASLRSHLETQHDVYQPLVIGEEYLEERQARTYRARASAYGIWHCPVEGCVGEARTRWTLRRHFRDRHPSDFVYIPEEGGVYSKCDRCGMQTNPAAYPGHWSSNLCIEGAARKEQHETAVAAGRALLERFTIYGEELERVETFKYLGRLLSMDDNDGPAVRANLLKARKSWARISRVLREESVPPRVAGMFYKAVVQAVLLYGSESWNLTATSLKVLEGFHLRAAWRLAIVNRPRKVGDSWVYPKTEDVLEEVGLYSVEHYIRVRRDTIASHIATRPIFGLCRAARRRRGSASRQFWWDQEFTLDAASAADVAVVAAGEEVDAAA